MPSIPLIFKDKLAHFGEYGILAFLLARVIFHNPKEIPERYLLLTAIIFASLYGVTDEFHQSFVPGRSVDFFDWLADTIGAIMGAGFFLLIYNWRRPKMLLHLCCANCGIFAISQLRAKYRLTLFWYNPNIEPKEEYVKRLADVRKISRILKLPLIEGKYELTAWQTEIKGLTREPEGGKRCLKCLDFRLEKTAKLAKRLGFKNWGTSLTVGPMKNANVINELGRQKSAKCGIVFYEADFKKQDGFKKSVEMAKSWAFYRQNYCGCKYSQHK
ncbi:MAG: epoxyqueuosine reductase QueH [Patescibacteria group bacterium]